jgi:transglutaminase-like putative cysteine protease
VLAGAEAGLLALALGTAASFTRLFIGWSWFGRIAVPVVAAWAVSVITRRVGLRISWSVLVQTIAGVLVLSWVFAPGTLLVVLPTASTWTTLTDQVTASFSSFPDLVAPVAASDGFLVVIAAAVWVIAGFADVAALRFRAPVQAAIPYAATFAAIGILARESGRTAAAVCFVVGLAIYAAAQRALWAADRRWVAGRAARGTRAVFTGTLAVALVAVAAGVVVGPWLPGDSDPVVDLRQIGRGDGPRTVVSPFVGIRSLLGERSDQVMFTVQADAAAYWRLTALERYDADREIWVSRSRYAPVDGDLPPAMSPEIGGSTLTQTYTVEGLATWWLPAAYVPRQVDSDADLSYDRLSASLILRDESAQPSLTYQLDSVVPDLASVLADGVEPLSAELDQEYLDAPDLDPQTAQLVASVVPPDGDPFQQMVALQDWFRTEFTYDDQVDFSGADDAVGAFLSARRGFCQQFASTFALFARHLGIPSRVAVGFTPGDPVATADSGSDEDPEVEFVVRGRHAHAWPEVYFEGVGWVPFEPTPQRGNPQATPYTGVEPAQATAPPEQAVTTTSTTIAPPTQPTTPTSTPAEIDATASPEPEPAADGGDGWLLGATFLVVAAALVAGAAFVAARRRTRRRRDDAAHRSARIADAWGDAVRALAVIGLRSDSSETPVEFARRADRAIGSSLVTPLAAVETRRRFGREAPSATQCEDAQRWASAVVDHVRAVTTRRQRVGSRLGS